MPERKQAQVRVEGIVQGVGFRPFCYRSAENLGLKGWVKNTGDAGVRIKLEGEEESIEKFLEVLKNDNPPSARIDGVKVSWTEPSELEGFRILESDSEKMGKSSVIPPDTSLCDECYQEMMHPDDRRYHYPFITCVNCGPRFTTIEDLPYDRERTSMREFPLCEDCLREYEDPGDRRYHAESISCPANGPVMQLYGSSGTEIETENPIKRGAELLDGGKIVAVKGIGGIHVAAKTTDNSVLRRLRKEFGRPEQPLAIMARDLKTVRDFAKVNEKEEELLTSKERPITVVKKGDDYYLSELISPDLDSVGVMLPYSGIHQLLFHHGKEPAYIMTSANYPGLPMMIKNSEIMPELSQGVDYFLLHNREIINRCDDSVVRLSGGSPTFLRRSRGYVPTPIDTPAENERTILALGADLDDVISISKDGRIFPSQYIGDVDNLETVEYLRRTVRKFFRWLNIKDLEIVACDLHPEFSTTELAGEMAKKFEAELIQVQHHEAHLYSLMAETGVDELVGILADGVGYGRDGTIWGGEIMTISSGKPERVGWIRQYPLPGGDLATKFPARSLAGILWEERNAGEIEEILEKHCKDWLRDGENEVIIQQLQGGFNTPLTSSTGRVLDAISCVLGVCGKRTYEGEPAIKLEAVANRGNPDLADLRMPVTRADGGRILDAGRLLIEVIEEMEGGTDRKHIAAAAQRTLGESLAKIAVEEAQERGIKNIGVSGGVFYNDSITKSVRKTVAGEKLSFLKHEKIPPGDGGISAGQAFSVMRNSPPS